MNAMTKDQLLERIEREHATFAGSFAQLSDAQMTQPGVENEWSIKDILAHISLWHRRMSYLIDCALHDEPFAPLRREGEDGGAAIDRVNAENEAANKHRPLAEVRAEYVQAYDQALANVARLTDDDLGADSRLSAFLGGSLPELIAGDTYEHYQEHLPAIKAWAEQNR
jgi:Protein of unknown function (DUF1706)